MSRFAVAVVVALVAGRAHAEPVKSKDGKITISLPKGWEEAPEDSPMRKGFLTPDAKIFARAPGIPAFAIAFREAKEDLTVKTLADYIALIAKLDEKKMPGRTVGPEKKLKLGDHEAVQYEMKGEFQGANLLYVRTYMQTPTHWVQITCWATPSHKKEMMADCTSILSSFQEVKHAKD